MKKLVQFRSLALVFALALGTLVSCKDKETVVDENTTTETTTMDVDTTAMPSTTTVEETTVDTMATPAK